MLPETILINLVDTSGLPVQNIALMLHVFSKKKNDVDIILPNSNVRGQVQISKEEIEDEINFSYRIFMMDYVTGLENYKDTVSVEVMSTEVITRAYRAGMDYHQRLNNPKQYEMLERAENFRIKEVEKYIETSNDKSQLKITLVLSRQKDKHTVRYEEDYIKDSPFIRAGYGNMDGFIKSFDINDINRKSRFGIGLLHASIAGQKYDIAEYLLAKGIDINMVDYEGRSALHYTKYFPNLDMTKKLLERGADINIKDIHGNNAF